MNHDARVRPNASFGLNDFPGDWNLLMNPDAQVRPNASSGLPDFRSSGLSGLKVSTMLYSRC